MVQRFGPLMRPRGAFLTLTLHGQRARRAGLRRRHVVGQGRARVRHAHARLRGRAACTAPASTASRPGPWASRAASAIGFIEQHDRLHASATRRCPRRSRRRGRRDRGVPVQPARQRHHRQRRPRRQGLLSDGRGGGRRARQLCARSNRNGGCARGAGTGQHLARMPRQLTHRYADPVDEIWLAAAKRLGLEVRRSDGAYAAYDGQGVLTLAERKRLRRRRLAGAADLPRALPRAGRGRARCVARLGPVQHRRPRSRARARVPPRCRPRSARAMACATSSRSPPITARTGTRCPAIRSRRRRRGDPAIELARAAWQRARRGRVGETLHAALAATRRSLGGAAVRGAGLAVAHDSAAAPQRLPAAARRVAALRRLRLAVPGGGQAGRAALPHDARRRRPTGRARRARATVACERFEPQARRGRMCELRRVLPRRFRSRARARARTDGATPSTTLADATPRFARAAARRVVASRSMATARPTRPYRCRVYADRPRACAEFELAGDACLEGAPPRRPQPLTASLPAPTDCLQPLLGTLLVGPLRGSQLFPFSDEHVTSTWRDATSARAASIRRAALNRDAFEDRHARVLAMCRRDPCSPAARISISSDCVRASRTLLPDFGQRVRCARS